MGPGYGPLELARLPGAHSTLTANINLLKQLWKEREFRRRHAIKVITPKRKIEEVKGVRHIFFQPSKHSNPLNKGN